MLSIAIVTWSLSPVPAPPVVVIPDPPNIETSLLFVTVWLPVSPLRVQLVIPVLVPVVPSNVFTDPSVPLASFAWYFNTPSSFHKTNLSLSSLPVGRLELLVLSNTNPVGSINP